MKKLQLALILSLMSYCFTDTDVDICETGFQNSIKNICTSIGSCSYDITSDTCFEISADCSKGNGNDADVCQSIIPSEYQTYKWELVGEVCTKTKKLCSDYGKIGVTSTGSKYPNYSGDDCSLLSPPAGKGDICILDSNGCKPHFNSCSSITDPDPNPGQCNNNIPKSDIKKCNWIPASGTTPAHCTEETRYCDQALKFDKNICTNLKLREDDDENDANYQNYKCISTGSACQKVYKNCGFYSASSEDDCKNYTPLNRAEDDYDYTHRCSYDSEKNICISVERKCKEYTKIPTSLLNEDMCKDLKTSKNYYRCAYKGNSCYEEYKTCEDYISNKINTDRNGCEGIVLEDKSKKCVYITEEDRCVTRDIYPDCEDYKGTDRKICESIGLTSDSVHTTCILDKDSKCVKRPLLCSEVYNKYDCLNIAKASSEDKICAYDSSNNICYEEYKICEDYHETDTSIGSNSCPDILLYNGKKCKWEINSNLNTHKCKSIDKTCGDANTKEECEFIAKTGVSDPERRLCYWTNNEDCEENYKYCSDYRKICDTSSITDCQDTCSKIKPYDNSGENPLFGFKCKYENNVGCQREPVECSDANNPILCNAYSQYIKDSNKKYCAFYDDQCQEYYKKCEDVEMTGPSQSTLCTNNIIEGYIKGVCQYENENNKCVTKDDCNLLNTLTTKSNYYKELCLSINPNCSYYSSPIKCTYEEKTCGSIKFHNIADSDERKKEICDSMSASTSYKICTLNEDKSGCIEIYKNFTYSTIKTAKDATPPTENSGFIITYGFIMILLGLLI